MFKLFYFRFYYKCEKFILYSRYSPNLQLYVHIANPKYHFNKNDMIIELLNKFDSLNN